MKILIIPLFVILLPTIGLFLTIKCWKKDKKISIGLKFLLGVTFVLVGLVATWFSVIVSVWGHMTPDASGGVCASGAVIFIPLGLIVNFIGIPLVLILEENIRGTRGENKSEKLENH